MRHLTLKPKTASTVPKRANSRSRAEARTLEDGIVSLALRGKLARAGREAIKANRAKGIPTTFKRGNQVVKEFPDGTVEVLETVPTPNTPCPKG